VRRGDDGGDGGDGGGGGRHGSSFRDGTCSGDAMFVASVVVVVVVAVRSEVGPAPVM
jgi:hypothetical protein